RARVRSRTSLRTRARVSGARVLRPCLCRAARDGGLCGPAAGLRRAAGAGVRGPGGRGCVLRPGLSRLAPRPLPPLALNLALSCRQPQLGISKRLAPARQAGAFFFPGPLVLVGWCAVPRENVSV